ncbi:MAG TPA: SRPBCC family protein [Polyangiaceae bacterium]
MKNPTTVERTSDRELVVTRAFNARASIVFDAMTNLELVKRWWAPRSLGVTLFSCEAEVRVGGKYRYVFGKDPAQPMAFSGEYKELVPHSRIVFTQVFEPLASAGEAVITITLEERDGKTHMVGRQLFPSKQALDGAVSSGMEKGMRETYDQLDALTSATA